MTGAASRAGTAKMDKGGRFVLVLGGDPEVAEELAALGELDRFALAASGWLRDSCGWNLKLQPVSLEPGPDRFKQDCWRKLLGHVADADTHAVALGFDPASPLGAADIAELASSRRTGDQFMLVHFTTIDRLSPAIEMVQARLLTHTDLRPVLVVPNAPPDAYLTDFESALAHHGVRIITERFGVSVRTIEEAGVVLMNALRRPDLHHRLGPECQTAKMLRSVALGDDTRPGDERVKTLLHILDCVDCSATCWDHATIARFAGLQPLGHWA